MTGGTLDVPRKVQVHLQLLSVAVFAGALGGAVNMLLMPLWTLLHLAGSHGILTSLTIGYTTEGLYHQVFWGGVWGLMLGIPLHRHIPNLWLRAFTFGIPPALVAMAIIIPKDVSGAGFFSMGLGWLTPLFVLLANTVGWSIPAYLWFGAAMALPGFSGNSLLNGDPPLLDV